MCSSDLIGKRGMGALTYSPAIQRKNLNRSQQVEVQSLIFIAQEILDKREQFQVTLGAHGQEDEEAMMALLSVGMSAGGARAKAVLAFNSDFTQVRSGQTNAPEGFTHFVMKFDGVSEIYKNKETFGDPLGYTLRNCSYFIYVCHFCFSVRLSSVPNGIFILSSSPKK